MAHRVEHPEVHRAEVPLDEVVHWSLYLVSMDMNLGKPHLSSPCLRAFPSFERTGSAVLSPESGAAQWRLPSGAVRLLKWDLRLGER